jgi:SAM-dependent methyltransferase
VNPDETQRLLERYNQRLAEFGYSPQTLGWTKPKHRVRYKILLDYWDMHTGTPQSVLDFGCGFGDLYAFALEQGIDIAYSGFDLNENLIEVARKVHPDAHFWVGDPINDGLQRNYDVILSSGAHNYRLTDNAAYVERTFEVFHKHARRGFAVNFLSDRVNVRNADNAYTRPEFALELALRYSSRVQLRHDYMPFEFTIFVDKADEFSDEFTVFREYERWCNRPSAAPRGE